MIEGNRADPVRLSVLPPEEFADLGEAIEYVNDWLAVIGSAANGRGFSLHPEPFCEGVRDVLSEASCDLRVLLEAFAGGFPIRCEEDSGPEWRREVGRSYLGVARMYLGPESEAGIADLDETVAPILSALKRVEDEREAEFRRKNPDLPPTREREIADEI